MEDVRMPLAEPIPPISTPAPPSEPASIPTLDGWIESLMNCKQLAEADVQRLCDKVRIDRSEEVGAAVGEADNANLGVYSGKGGSAG